MSNKPGKLIVLSAPSGGGKSTLVGLLLERHKGKFVLSISYTTRPIRGKEVHGQDYYFVSDSEFQEMIARGEFLEYAHVFQRHWYGTSRTQVESTMASGKHVLLDIDVQGAKALKRSYGARCVTIFLEPPSLAELERRLRERKTDSSEAIETRLQTAREEISQAATFDYRFINQKIDQALRDLEVILQKVGCL